MKISRFVFRILIKSFLTPWRLFFRLAVKTGFGMSGQVSSFEKKIQKHERKLSILRLAANFTPEFAKCFLAVSAKLEYTSPVGLFEEKSLRIKVLIISFQLRVKKSFLLKYFQQLCQRCIRFVQKKSFEEFFFNF